MSKENSKKSRSIKYTSSLRPSRRKCRRWREWPDESYRKTFRRALFQFSGERVKLCSPGEKKEMKQEKRSCSIVVPLCYIHGHSEKYNRRRGESRRTGCNLPRAEKFRRNACQRQNQQPSSVLNGPINVSFDQFLFFRPVDAFPPIAESRRKRSSISREIIYTRVIPAFPSRKAALEKLVRRYHGSK